MTVRRKEFCYAQLADTIEGLIRRGVWQPGEKVPSVRQLRAQHGVSLSTAFQAYYHLENKGVLEARPKAGYFVRRLSRPAAVDARAASHRGAHQRPAHHLNKAVGAVLRRSKAWATS
jgi:DNA-binding transcriptional regulator YhcF (GntR family)